jgi:hypothetical protein
MAALVFTGTGADAAQDTREKVGHVVDGVRPIVSAFEQGTNVGRNVCRCRTGGLAGDIDVHVVEIFRAGRINDLLGHIILASLESNSGKKPLHPESTKLRIHKKSIIFVFSRLRVFVIDLSVCSALTRFQTKI